MPRLDTGPLVARLMERAEGLAAGAVAMTAMRLSAQPQPEGITADALSDGIRLSGKRLKLRIVRDPGIGRVVT